MGRKANIEDYIGKRYNHCVIIGEASNLKVYGETTVRCKCDCGNEFDVRLWALKSGNTKGCGCLIRESSRLSGQKCAIDLTGQKFGRLTVISRYGPSNGGLKWNCICKCGNEVVVRGYKLRKGITKSCGCLRSDTSKARLIDFTGQRFGRWLVLERSGTSDNWRIEHTKWLCRCDCGTERVVPGTILSNGTSTSCGCSKSSFQSRKRISALKRGIDIEDWDGFAFDDNLRSFRNSAEYRNWRSEVYMRDNWTCQKCGEKSGTLRAHHLNSYTDFPDQRLNVSNGSTLCVKCHNLFHKKFGTHHNTYEQFIEWLSEYIVNELEA